MKIVNILSLLFCGFSIGWLMGLSASPIIQTVVGSLLAVITSVLTLLSGVQEGEMKEKITNKLGNINIFPLSVFLIGLSVSATLGIYARTNDWFGINPKSFKHKWELKDKDSSGIIEALYNELHPQESKKSNNLTQGVLFNHSEGCDELLKINDAEILADELRLLGPEWQSYVDSIGNNIAQPETLEILRQKIIETCKLYMATKIISTIFILFFALLANSQDFAEINKSVVKVVYSCSDLGKAKTGTGFVWKKSNQIVTALHLVTGNCTNGSINIFIPTNTSFSKGTFYSAKIVKILKSSDLALLEVSAPNLKPLNSISSSLFIKQLVDVIGYPLGALSKRSIQLSIPFNESKKLRPNIPANTISELNKLEFNVDMDVVHFQGSLLPGLSGAPIFNDKAQIIAIGNGGLNKGQVGISWGIPASKLLELETSSDDIKSINSSYIKSSEIAFSAEIPIAIGEFGEDFLIAEKNILRKDFFALDNLEFYKVGVKSFSEILRYSNDQTALTALINAFQKSDLTKTEFTLYRNFETGATFVLPVGYSLFKKENAVFIKSNNESIQGKLQYYKLANSYDIMDELCINGKINRPVDSLSFWQKNFNWSYQWPVTTFDGQFINREGFSKNYFVNNSNIVQQIEFQFTTTAKKNKDLFFLILTDKSGSTEYTQNLSLCLQDPNTPFCTEVLMKWNEIAKLVFCQYLFSFSI